MMGEGNGQVDEAVATQAVQAAAAEVPKPRLAPDVLTPRDILRAKAKLGDVLAGRSAYELLDGDEMFPFIIWALRSRTNPNFTWDQALDSPFGEFDMGGGGEAQGPPPTPTPASPGSETNTPAAAASASRPQQRGRGRSSAGSST